MKRIKMLLIIILISLLSTGCSVEYNITVNSDTIKEEIIVTDKVTTKRNKETILSHYNKWYPTYVNYLKGSESIPLPNFNKKYDGIEYHNKNIIEINNGYKYTYLYEHKIDNYYDSYALANTFKDTTIQQNGDSLVLKTSKESFFCKYDYFDSLKVNITIDPTAYELNYTNTKNINNNTYTWVISKNNCNNSQIILTLNEIKSSDDIVEVQKKVNKKENEYIIYIFWGIVLIIVTIVYFIVKKYKQKLEDFDIDD